MKNNNLISLLVGMFGFGMMFTLFFESDSMILVISVILIFMSFISILLNNQLKK